MKETLTVTSSSGPPPSDGLTTIESAIASGPTFSRMTWRIDSTRAMGSPVSGSYSTHSPSAWRSAPRTSCPATWSLSQTLCARVRPLRVFHHVATRQGTVADPMVMSSRPQVAVDDSLEFQP